VIAVLVAIAVLLLIVGVAVYAGRGGETKGKAGDSVGAKYGGGHHG
jgi:hypothetical protein